MHNKNRNVVLATFTLLIVLISVSGQAQELENEFQTRTKLDLGFKPLKKVKFTIMPELRFEDDFSLDKYILEGEAEYKISKLLKFGASYGFIGNLRDVKNTEYFSRYALSITLKKEFNRFEPSLRLMYSNYADDEIDDKNYLRYKASLKYDINNFKLTPYLAVQAFQQLNDGGLYKMRYAAGGSYKLMKNHYLNADYKLDYYNMEYKNRHIISIGYKINF